MLAGTLVLAVAVLAIRKDWSSPGEPVSEATDAIHGVEPPGQQAREAAVQAEALLREFHRLNDLEALDDATGHIFRALQLDPESPRALYAAGLTHDARAEYAVARSYFARLLQSEPDNAPAHAAAAHTYLPQGDLGTALNRLQMAHAADPRDYRHSGGLLMLSDSLEDYAGAAHWSEWLSQRMTNQPRILALQARHHYLTGRFEAAVQTSNLALNLDLSGDWYANAIFMRIKRDEALAGGTPQAGIAFFADRHPDLFGVSPTITPANISQALDLAYLLKLAGQRSRAAKLALAAVKAYARPYFASGSARAWLVPARAEAMAILGDGPGALAELQRIAEEGWRLHWRWETEMNPNFTAIRDDDEFRALVGWLEADMAAQRARATL